MLFNSLPFALLFSLTLLSCRVVERSGWVILAASVVFYTFAGPFDFLLFTTMIVANWAVSLIRSRHRLALAVVLNIGVLAALKYVDLLLGREGGSGSYVDAALPLGISFYTFQMLAYQIDLTRGRAASARSLPEFATFVAFFPQLIAGPIVRSRQLVPQIERLFRGQRRRLRLASFGLGLICLGLTKKVVFADSLAPIVDGLFAAPLSSVYEAWRAAYLFGFQIYFDFSGYSDIAVGAAYLLGIRLPFNFSTPYISKGPREFWQRWHITLSEWIRDYLYIPLGGSRGGPVRSFAVLVFVMALAGLWHGANLTFFVWGATWGVYLGLVRLGSDFIRLPGWVSWGPHMLLVFTLWVFFRAPGIEAGLNHLKDMFGLSGLPLFHQVGPGEAGLALTLAGCAGLMILQFAECRLRKTDVIGLLRRWNGPVAWSFLGSLSLLILLLPQIDGNAFIYFRF